MKIHGPGPHEPTAVPPTEATATEAAPAAAPAAAAAAPPAAAAAPPAAAATEPLHALAADLRAGRLTSAEALERLIDRAAARVADLASPEAAERLRAALLDLAARDPVLRAKVEALRKS